MTAIDYKHTWTLPRDSKVIRFYMWLWDASPRDVNFCKLFWGYLFALPNLLVRLFLLPFALFAKLVVPLLPTPPELSEEEQLRRMDERLEQRRIREQRAQRILGRIERAGARFAYVFKFYVWRWLRYPVVVLVGLVALAAVVALGYLLATAWWHVTWKVLVVVGGSVVVFAPLAFGVNALAARGKFDRVAPKVEVGATKVFGVLIAPFAFFLWVMVMGFKGVKSNTCPRVVLVGPEDREQPATTAEGRPA